MAGPCEQISYKERQHDHHYLGGCPTSCRDKHDYQDERVCVGAIVMSFASMLLSFFTVYTIFNVSASTKYSCLIYPGFSIIAILTSVKILKKDKDLLAAKCSLGISIASLIITIGIAIFVAIYVG